MRAVSLAALLFCTISSPPQANGGRIRAATVARKAAWPIRATWAAFLANGHGVTASWLEAGHRETMNHSLAELQWAGLEARFLEPPLIDQLRNLRRNWVAVWRGSMRGERTTWKYVPIEIQVRRQGGWETVERWEGPRTMLNRW